MYQCREANLLPGFFLRRRFREPSLKRCRPPASFAGRGPLTANFRFRGGRTERRLKCSECSAIYR